MRLYILKNEQDIINCQQFLTQVEIDQENNKKIALEAFDIEDENQVDIFGYHRAYLFKNEFFKFKEEFKHLEDKVDPKRVVKDNEGYWKLNKRTKIGKQAAKLLDSQKQHNWFTITTEIFDQNTTLPKVKLTSVGTRIQLPRVFRLNKSKQIILGCDDAMNLDKDRFEETTRTYVDDNDQ